MTVIVETGDYLWQQVGLDRDSLLNDINDVSRVGLFGFLATEVAIILTTSQMDIKDTGSLRGHRKKANTASHVKVMLTKRFCASDSDHASVYYLNRTVDR